jgi:hypothetical protein
MILSGIYPACLGVSDVTVNGRQVGPPFVAFIIAVDDADRGTLVVWRDVVVVPGVGQQQWRRQQQQQQQQARQVAVSASLR